MSFAAARASKRARQTCQSCRDRKARFRFRGAVRADRNHTLCFECYRSERERQRAMRLSQAPAAPVLRVALPTRAVAGSLSDREVAHRRAMLAQMEQNALTRAEAR
jgi:hypothetical protein